MIEKSIEDKFIRKIKRWFESLLDKGSMWMFTQFYRSYTHPSWFSLFDDGDDDQERLLDFSVPGSDVPRESGHINSIDTSLQTPQDRVNAFCKILSRYFLQLLYTSSEVVRSS